MNGWMNEWTERKTLLYIRSLTTKYRGNDGVRKSSFDHHCDKWFRQELMDARLAGEVRNRILA